MMIALRRASRPSLRRRRFELAGRRQRRLMASSCRMRLDRRTGAPADGCYDQQWASSSSARLRFCPSIITAPGRLVGLDGGEASLKFFI